MDFYITEFSKTLKNLLSELNRCQPDKRIKDTHQNFDKLDIYLLVVKYYSTFCKSEKLITGNDDSFLKEPVMVLPDIDISKCYNACNLKQKKKIFIYIKLLYSMSSQIIDLTVKGDPNNKSYNLHQGINKSEISVKSLIENKTYQPDNDQSSKDGKKSHLSTMMSTLGMLGFDINNLKTQMEQLKKPGAVDELVDATNKALREMVGGSLDKDTEDMFSSIARDVYSNFSKVDTNKDIDIEEIAKASFDGIFKKNSGKKINPQAIKKILTNARKTPMMQMLMDSVIGKDKLDHMMNNLNAQKK
jgi:hypothetical protein